MFEGSDMGFHFLTLMYWYCVLIFNNKHAFMNQINKPVSFINNTFLCRETFPWQITVKVYGKIFIIILHVSIFSFIPLFTHSPHYRAAKSQNLFENRKREIEICLDNASFRLYPSLFSDKKTNFYLT